MQIPFRRLKNVVWMIEVKIVEGRKGGDCGVERMGYGNKQYAL